MEGARSRRPLLGLALAALAVVVVGGLLLQRGSGERVVVVYTAHAQEDVDALLPLFERATGIRVEHVKMGSGEVIQRVRAERARPQCDVIWSIAGDQLEANADLLAEYRPAAAEAVAPQYRVGARWLPYTGLVLALVVNTEALPEGARPRTWADLADPRLKGKVVTARADSSGSAYMQLSTILQVHGEDGWEVYRGILENATLSGSSSAVPRLVNDGEAAVGLTLEDNAQRYVAGGGPVAIVYPEDGTAVAPDGVALVDGAPHPEAARAFIDWALSREVQQAIAARGRRPVREDVARPAGLPPLSSLKTVPYDFERAARLEGERVARWTALVAELGR